MTRVTMDMNTLSKFAGLHDPVEVCDEAGEVVGFFRPAIPTSELKRMRAESPFSDHELQRMWSQERIGRPLAEILEDLGQR
jgi:hypothetical protein